MEMGVGTLKAGPAAASGNGVVVDCHPRDGAWVVEFMSEPRTSPQPLWFHLSCRVSEPARVEFVWLNADSCLGLGQREGLLNVRPVVKMDDGEWQRVETTKVEPRESGGNVLSFAAPAPAKSVAAAFCYPYGPDELRATLSDLDGAWAEEPIGLTGDGRPLPRLRAATEGEPAIGAYVMARQHAGESPGSWVLDGLLRAVAAAEPAAPLRQVQWWVVPFVDMDGVVSGNYGKDAMPWDFNRAWALMPMRPEIVTIQRDMHRFVGHVDRRLVVDLHGPGGAEKAIYQFLPRDERPAEQRETSLTFSARLTPEFPHIPTESLVRVPRYPSRWTTSDTATTWSWDHLQQTLGVSIETTYQGLEGGPWYGPADYADVGARIARAAAAWLAQP